VSGRLFRVVDDEIRIDASEPERAIRQILARVAKARSLGEQPKGFLKRVVHLQGCVYTVLCVERVTTAVFASEHLAD
jgi:hypothetical protein